MPDLSFLDMVHEEYTARQAEWLREERRLYGGDAVIPHELTRWKNEDEDHFKARLREAEYHPIGSGHASTMAGHIERVRQSFSLGGLGEVRPRDKWDSDPTLGELIYYNVDNVGSDGSEWPAWTAGVQVRACATGFRWARVEAPAFPDDRKPSKEDMLRNGIRPWAVEDSPLAWPMWEGGDNGKPLQWAYRRVRTERSRVVNGTWTKADPARLGYYLLVREGCTDLGTEFEKGGWWLIDPDKNLIPDAYGSWAKTRGEVPLFRLVADDSMGTTEYPASSRSLTAPLGQIAVGLMNRISERDYDASDAAKSIRFFLGMDPSTEGRAKWNFTATFMEQGSHGVPVPYSVVVTDDKGGKAVVVPTVYDSSASAMPAEVFDKLFLAKLQSAREIMMRQVTEPQASGKSRELAFAGTISPLLGTLAARRQAFENTLIYFFELRGGVETPSGSATFKREVPLQPVVDDIDRLIATMQKAGLKSATLSAHLGTKQGEELGLIPDEIAKKVKAEFQASAESAVELEEADVALISAMGGGAPRPRGKPGAPNTNGNNVGSGERGTQNNGATGNGVATDDAATRQAAGTSDEGGSEGADIEAVRAQLEAVQSSVNAFGDQLQALSDQLKAAQGQQPIVPPITIVEIEKNGGEQPKVKTKRIDITKTESGGYTATVTPESTSGGT